LVSGNYARILVGANSDGGMKAQHRSLPIVDVFKGAKTNIPGRSPICPVSAL
jgi:hypothetical protein